MSRFGAGDLSEFRRRLSEQAERRKAARERRAKRRRVSAPWKVIRDRWHQLYAEHFGGDVQADMWTGAEARLAKKAVSDVGLDEFIGIMEHAFETWGRRKVPGVPGLKWIWANRASLLAEMRGSASAPGVRVLEDEFVEGEELADGW